MNRNCLHAHTIHHSVYNPFIILQSLCCHCTLNYLYPFNEIAIFSNKHTTLSLNSHLILIVRAFSRSLFAFSLSLDLLAKACTQNSIECKFSRYSHYVWVNEISGCLHINNWTHNDEIRMRCWNKLSLFLTLILCYSENVPFSPKTEHAYRCSSASWVFDARFGW